MRRHWKTDYDNFGLRKLFSLTTITSSKNTAVLNLPVYSTQYHIVHTGKINQH